jgi:dolichol-phosphate mannosyltransferase
MPPGGCDFVLIDRAVVNLLLAIGEKNPYLIGLILWVGFDRAVIPYTRQRRTAGRSRWTLAKRVKYFIDALVAFSYVPMRFVSGLGILLALGGLVFAAIVAGNTLIAGAPIEGWTSLMVVLLIVSGAQLLALGIFGEYLWRNFEEIRKRPSFVVDEVRGRSENRL